ncbi:MAG: polysaccharide deacetylase family protein [Nanoarchaeota archaeon]
MRLVNISVDVEKDLHSDSFLGVTNGLKLFEKLAEKYNFKPTLFVTGDVIEKHGNIFKILQDKGWEIGYHSYNHKRYDEMSFKEKEEDIRKGLVIFEKYGLKMKGFRAPQHSIDKETFSLLKKNEFKYDSSIAAKDGHQLVHVFKIVNKKPWNWLKQVFSKSDPYNKNGVYEIPTSALFFSFVGYSLRVFPLVFIKFLFLIFFRRKIVVFYCHSWDFIELKNSLTYRVCNLNKFLNRLDKLLFFMAKKGKFVKLEDVHENINRN